MALQQTTTIYIFNIPLNPDLAKFTAIMTPETK